LSELCVRADRLSKRFLVLKSQKSLLRALRSVAGGKSLRREHWVLRDLTFDIRKGEKVALLGRNGSGKTTLLRLLTGIFEQTGGTLLVRSRPRALFSCSIGFLRDLPVVDNLYLFGAIHGIDRSVLAPREGEILDTAEVRHLAYSPMKELSLGQVQRLALSVFSQTPSDFLIFDEVLSNVDHGFLRQSEAYFDSLTRSDRTILLTSHDASFLRKHCERAIWLDGGMVKMSGPFETVIGEYERSFGQESSSLVASPR
jgi:ABC-type polysaccharide/polyol phosphate transport system ATPase subunit